MRFADPFWLLGTLLAVAVADFGRRRLAALAFDSPFWR